MNFNLNELSHQERIPFLDTSKGIAIVLVVAGHVIQYVCCSDEYMDNIVFRYIYSFHMQFFIMLSGMTFNSAKLNTWNDIFYLAKRRAVQLLLPFFLWTFIVSLLSLNPNYLINSIIHPEVSFWFLWDLFFINVSMALGTWLGKMKKINLYYSLFIIFILWILIGKLAGGWFDLTRCGNLFVFYVIGYFCKNIRISLSVGCVITLGYLILAYFWYPDKSVTVGDISLINKFIGSFPHRIAVATAGCFSLLFICKHTQKILNNSWFNKLGKVTLGIYVVHLTLVRILNLDVPFDNIIIGLFTYTFILTFVSYCIVSCIMRIKRLKLYLLGKV